MRLLGAVFKFPAIEPAIRKSVPMKLCRSRTGLIAFTKCGQSVYWPPPPALCAYQSFAGDLLKRFDSLIGEKNTLPYDGVLIILIKFSGGTK